MTPGREVRLADGRVLRAYDSAGAGSDSGGPALVWHHGSPQTGAPLDPLLAAARERGIRLVSYGRPSYGGSSPHPGRDVASAAGDVEQVLDALGVETFATMGASGGGPHALACAALLAGRVTGVVCLAGLAPYDGRGEWFAGMRSDGALRAAVAGRATRERHEETATFDEDQFTAADWAALSATWTSLGEDAGRAGSEGPAGLIDDDLAFVGTWGFDLAAVTAPALFVHGGEDRVVPLAHSERLVWACSRSELWLRPRDGHVSVLDACPVAMDWLLAAARG